MIAELVCEALQFALSHMHVLCVIIHSHKALILYCIFFVSYKCISSMLSYIHTCYYNSCKIVSFSKARICISFSEGWMCISFRKRECTFFQQAKRKCAFLSKKRKFTFLSISFVNARKRISFSNKQIFWKSVKVQILQINKGLYFCLEYQPHSHSQASVYKMEDV